ncbi:MAG: hypothetical protein N2445_02020 [Acidobacteria bacterium]|nr:hypothetical protein [Acidobacteriota bacterium]
MKNLLIKVYGDSLSLPRPQDNIDFGEEYSFLLKLMLEEKKGENIFLWNRSLGGARIIELYKNYERDKFYIGKSGILIIQSGVVDCAPRPLPLFLRELLSVSPSFIKWRVSRFLHNNRARILRSGLGTRPTPPKKFKKTLSKWLESAIKTELLILIINIAPNTDAIERHSPGFRRSIELYNKIICETVSEVNCSKISLIDVNSKIKEVDKNIEFLINQKDGHHITKEGHRLYSEMLIKSIKEKIDFIKGEADVCKN